MFNLLSPFRLCADTQHRLDGRLACSHSGLPGHSPLELPLEWRLAMQRWLLGHGFLPAHWSRIVPGSERPIAQPECAPKKVDFRTPQTEEEAQVVCSCAVQDQMARVQPS